MTTAHTITDEDWLDHAWCKRSGQGDRWIYPDGRHPPADRTPEHAQQRCAPCPVQYECARYTLQRTLPFDMIQAGKAWGRTEIERLHTAEELADEHGLPAPTSVTNNRGTKPGSTYTHNRGHCARCSRFMLSDNHKLGPGEARYGGRDMCDRCYKHILREEDRASRPRQPHPGLPDSIIRDNHARSRQRQERVAATRTLIAEMDNNYAAMRAELVRRYNCSESTAEKYIIDARRKERETAS